MTAGINTPEHPEPDSERSASRYRYRQAGLTAIASMAARAVTVLVGIAVVPLALGYLGTERYGIWLTLSSFLALLGFMDLGLGNAVMTAVARTGSGQDREATARYVSTGFYMLITVAAVGGIGWAVISSFVDWSDLLDVRSAAATEIAPTVAVLIGILLINLPLGVAGKTQWGLQRGYISSLWQAGGSAVGLVGLIAVIHFEAGLPWLALAISGGTAVGALANSIVMFGWWGRWLRPTLKRLSRNASAELARLGGLFLGLQMAVVVAFASDNLIVARVLGVDAVPSLAVPFKLFAFIPMLLSFAIAPLWPAYGDALGKRDFGWARKALGRSLALSVLISAVLSLGLLVGGDWLLGVWTDGAIEASPTLMIGLAVWTILSAAGTAIAMLLNAAAVIRFQLVTAWSMAIVAVVLKVVLIPHMGVAGAIWATVIAYFFLIIVPDSLFLPRFLRRMTAATR